MPGVRLTLICPDVHIELSKLVVFASVRLHRDTVVGINHHTKHVSCVNRQQAESSERN